jgi:hypothetical protein
VNGKAFFFEKRSKNFCDSGLSLSGKAEAKMTRSFLLLFFKKEDLPFLPPLSPQGSWSQ